MNHVQILIKNIKLNNFSDKEQSDEEIENFTNISLASEEEKTPLIN